jgi:protease II
MGIISRKSKARKMSGWKMNKAKSLSLVCAVLWVLGGCAKQQQFETVEQICVGDSDKAKVMQMAEDVLGEMHFSIAKSDVEQGLIRTKPLAGAQFFEFWRRDSIGAFNQAEANLHSVRKVVEMNVSKEEGRLCVGCNVDVQRLSLPERRIRGRGRSYEMFSTSSSTMQRIELDEQQKRLMAWVDLGRDKLLETEILKRIEKKMAGLRKEK